MELYRIAKKKYIQDLSGTGAKLAGNRWNNKGVAVLYTSSTLSLSTLECLVHFPPAYVPNDYAHAKLFCPDDSMQEVSINILPQDWQYQAASDITKSIGDTFVAHQQYLCLKVPSAIVTTEFIYLLNPTHPRFSEVKILEVHDFVFDNRLF